MEDEAGPPLLRRTNFSRLLASFCASKLVASFLMGEQREVVMRATRRAGFGGLATSSTGLAAENNKSK